jgi:predicted TIM-barrel fold metal-dependent hydrolase
MLAHSGHAAAAAIVLSGALARFPDLRVVFAEFGFSWVAPLMWRMDTAWSRHGSDRGLERPPSHYLLDQMRFTTQPMDEPDNPRLLWRVLDAMDAKRTLLFSSDYPHWDADDPQVIMKTRLPAELRDRVAFGSALECFGDRLAR